MSAIQYRAVCEKCGHVEREGRDDKFLSAFFLPPRCNGCGDTKKRYERWSFNSGWRTEAGRYERGKYFWQKVWTPLEDNSSGKGMEIEKPPLVKTTDHD